jgi:hypothetical protein
MNSSLTFPFFPFFPFFGMATRKEAPVTTQQKKKRELTTCPRSAAEGGGRINFPNCKKLTNSKSAKLTDDPLKMSKNVGEGLFGCKDRLSFKFSSHRPSNPSKAYRHGQMANVAILCFTLRTEKGRFEALRFNVLNIFDQP